jgi:membrane-associated protein
MYRLFFKNMINLIDLFIHLDKYIGLMIQNYGILTYLIMFFVIFSETGFVLFTFFPGDTLLFVAGTFASTGAIKIHWLFIILSLAAILGDNLNYSIGKYFGEAILAKKRWVKEKNLEKTKIFFEKNGAKTIILARFIPIIRSLAPFVAGVSEMKYKKFFSYNVIGGILWVALMLSLGYFFGEIPFVKNNLSTIIIGIVILSWIPAIVAWIKREK